MFETKSRNPSHVAVLLVSALLTLSIAGPILAATGTLEAVAKMLRSGLSESVILDWLGDAPAPAHRPTADELIELQESGASDAVLRRLLELSRSASPSETAPLAAVQTPPSPAEAGPGRPSPQPRNLAAGSESGVPVSFTLRYAPEIEEDTEEWDLFVYIDGRPLTLVPAAGGIFSRKALEFERAFAPGSHQLEVVLERHTRRGPSTWFHAARAAAVALPLQLTKSSSRTYVELTFKQRSLDFGSGDGPLTYRVLRGDEVLELRETFGGDPDDWSPICEEIESNRRPGKNLSRNLRKELESCIAWGDLWPGRDTIMARKTVREKLALYNYRPVPRDAE